MAQRRACRCGRRLAEGSHPGLGLCGSCYQRKQRDELAARIGADGGGATEHAERGCPSLPCDEGKVLAMVARARKGLPLFRRDDARRTA